VQPPGNLTGLHVSARSDLSIEYTFTLCIQTVIDGLYFYFFSFYFMQPNFISCVFSKYSGMP